MSASDKKKLRKEQNAQMLSEKQRQAQAEAKKLKIYTIIFVAVIALVAVAAVATLVARSVTQSGIVEKNTIAAVVDGNELNTVEMAYYYNDAINSMYSQVNQNIGESYADVYFDSMGLDVTKSLSEQKNPETGDTWADYFVDSALESAKSDFAMYALAKEADFQLPEADKEELKSLKQNLESTAVMYGYANANKYLQAIYGFGADLDSYLEYLERSAIADAFYADHQENLTYDDAAIREKESENPDNYNSYDYAYCYMSYTEFREGGTEGEDGTKTYTAEEDAAAREKLAEAAEFLATATDEADMRNKIMEVEVNESSQLAVNNETNQLHSQINNELATWLASADRKAGDIAAIPNIAVVNADEAEDAEEADKTEAEDTEKEDKAEDVVNGYYVAIFKSRNDNKKTMSNVRHLLVQFEGGTTDESTGETVYSDEEKGIAKTEAESLLKKWQDGDATEESFIALVKEYSDDTSAEEGGLFEDINPHSQYVENFLNWSIDDNRKAGDAEVIETEYGYHVMYYVGDDEMTYRDHMITQELRTADQEEWFNEAVEAVKVSKKDLSKLNLDLVLAGNS